MARSWELVLCRTLILAAVLFAVLLRPLPVRAQSDPPVFPDDPPPWGDLASDEDPSLRVDDP